MQVVHSRNFSTSTPWEVWKTLDPSFPKAVMSGEATWQLTSPNSKYRRYIFTRSIFCGHVGLPSKGISKEICFFVLDYLTPKNMNMEATNGGLGRWFSFSMFGDFFKWIFRGVIIQFDGQTSINIRRDDHFIHFWTYFSVSWWLHQPIWKICLSNRIISPSRVQSRKYFWNHHLVYHCQLSHPILVYSKLQKLASVYCNAFFYKETPLFLHHPWNVVNFAPSSLKHLFKKKSPLFQERLFKFGFRANLPDNSRFITNRNTVLLRQNCHTFQWFHSPLTWVSFTRVWVPPFVI